MPAGSRARLDLDAPDEHKQAVTAVRDVGREVDKALRARDAAEALAEGTPAFTVSLPWSPRSCRRRRRELMPAATVPRSCSCPAWGALGRPELLVDVPRPER